MSFSEGACVGAFLGLSGCLSGFLGSIEWLKVVCVIDGNSRQLLQVLPEK